MTREEFIKWAVGKGYSEDKFGHFQKMSGGKRYRLKLGRIVIRHEVRITFKDKSSPDEWVRLASLPWKTAYINEAGNLRKGGGCKVMASERGK